MPELQIISANVCPFAQRTRMVLQEKGLEFEVVEIDLKDKPDWFAAVSPYGKVPVLRHDGRTIYESAVINEYLEEVFPDPALMPTDPARRAQARIWIEYCNSKFCPFFYKLLLAQDQTVQQELAQEMIAALRFIESEGMALLQDTGPYWMGEVPNLVDFTYYPFFERFAALAHYRDVTIPDDCHRLKAWLENMSRRPSAIDTGNPAPFYIKNYGKYADGSANGVTAREMKP
ncbi:MAG: glutathione S-transferase family protein [Rhodospirillales bacterium]|nr:glutathione S-transferase family protein [Rhodospirillales bacterium]